MVFNAKKQSLVTALHGAMGGFGYSYSVQDVPASPYLHLIVGGDDGFLSSVLLRRVSVIDGFFGVGVEDGCLTFYFKACEL